MTFLLHSINPLSAIRFPVRAEVAVILASLRTPDSDRVIATFDPLVIAFLQPVGPVVSFVIAPFHSRGLGESRKRSANGSRDD